MPQLKRESSQPRRRLAPATTPEARENQLISLAVDLAEKQLAAGTASSQVITHYLKLGSTRERLEQEKLRKEHEVLEARRDALKSGSQLEALAAKAIDAMRSYYGRGGDTDD